MPLVLVFLVLSQIVYWGMVQIYSHQVQHNGLILNYYQAKSLYQVARHQVQGPLAQVQAEDLAKTWVGAWQDLVETLPGSIQDLALVWNQGPDFLYASPDEQFVCLFSIQAQLSDEALDLLDLDQVRDYPAYWDSEDLNPKLEGLLLDLGYLEVFRDRLDWPRPLHHQSGRLAKLTFKQGEVHVDLKFQAISYQVALADSSFQRVFEEALPQEPLTLTLHQVHFALDQSPPTHLLENLIE